MQVNGIICMYSNVEINVLKSREKWGEDMDNSQKSEGVSIVENENRIPFCKQCKNSIVNITCKVKGKVITTHNMFDECEQYEERK